MPRLHTLAFRPEHVGPILAGGKIETRRFRTDLSVGDRCIAEANDQPFAELRVTDVYRQRIADFTEEDARREGYESHEDLWTGIIKSMGELRFLREMFVVRFELLGALDG